MRKLKHALFGVTIASALAACGSKTVEANYQVIPLPQQTTLTQDTPFRLSNNTVICFPQGNSLLERDAQFLAFYLKQSTGKSYGVQPYSDANALPANAIVLSLDSSLTHPEGYHLSVSSNQVSLKGQTANGLFYGIQTLRKAIPPTVGTNETVMLPAVEIADYPRFGYRGMHLDVGRHFSTVEFVKEFIDLLALHNMNTLHWHLTEDQGWRIEIKKYPNLTEVGAMRSETVIGHNSGTYDGTPHGGFYTQDEIKDIVAYAAERYINIIPEVDLPGHMLAALASYPEFGCTGGPYEVEKTWGVFDDVLCVGNEQAMQFLEDVMTEVVELFPSEYIHIGGDEAPRTRWKNCPKCQQRIKDEKLKADAKHSAEDRLQSYCMTRIERLLNEKGRRIIGWDELLEGDVAPNATIMSWRGVAGGIEAAQLGHDVVMTPNTYMYFDYFQTTDTKDEPDAIGGCITVEHAYSYEPIPAELTEEQKKHILGVQANLWTEYIPNSKQIEYMILPRMAALAEVQWTLPQNKDYKRFASALPRLMELYKRDGLNYATHIFDITSNFTYNSQQRAVIAELTTIDNAPIYYTLDGSTPTEKSTLYNGPVAINQNGEFKAIAIRKAGNSKIISETINFNKATCSPITISAQPTERYAFNGAITLVDGLKGTDNYASGRWLGFLSDVDAVIDLGKPTLFSQVSTEACVDIHSWIMGATGITVSVSDDGKNFRQVAEQSYPIYTDLDTRVIEQYALTFPEVTAQYVSVNIKCTPELPKGHPAAGKKAFMFIDEICIN